MSRQFAVRIDVAESQKFVSNAKAIGLKPSDALRVFVNWFNDMRGFPFDVVNRREAGSEFSAFVKNTAKNGQTPAEAIRLFIGKYNEQGKLPFD